MTPTPTGYTLVLPPGWVRIPLREGTREALDEQVFRRIEEIPATVPRDNRVAFRTEVRRRVERLVGEAQKAGGLDLYVPARARPEALLAASFLVSEVGPYEEPHVESYEPYDLREPHEPHESYEQPAPEAMLARLAADRRGGAAGAVREVAGTLAVRWEYVEPPTVEDDFDTYMRHVDYTLPVPWDGNRWLAVSFSTAGDGDPGSEFSRVLAELFDAMVSTFRWSYE